MDSVAGTVETVLVRRDIQNRRPTSAAQRLECRPFCRVRCHVEAVASVAGTFLD